MFNEMKTRKYTQKRRAEQQQQTRERIVEAAMALHEEVGPANTSIKAVAERAGVQRLTVYRHFPDDSSLFQACTSHWLALNPPPDKNQWQEVENPLERSRRVLLLFCRYYRQTEEMWRGSYRDLETVEALKIPMAEFEAYLDQIRDELLSTWQVKEKDDQHVAITLRHGLRFSTWQSLKRENLSDEQMADLVTEWLRAVC